MVTTWTDAAKRDLQQIYQRLAANDPAVAKANIEAILSATDGLNENFQAGKPEGLLNGEKVPYKYVTAGYYKILYTFNTEKVSIRSVFHLRQMAEQNQALIAQLDVKAAEVAAKVAEEAAAVAASQPAPEPVPEPVAETPVTPETPVNEPTATETTETPAVETPAPAVTENPTPEATEPASTDTATPAADPPMASTADLEALRAKMGGGGTPPADGGGDGGFDAAALEAELMADDEKEQDDAPEFKDISLDDMDNADKPAGE